MGVERREEVSETGCFKITCWRVVNQGQHA